MRASPGQTAEQTPSRERASPGAVSSVLWSGVPTPAASPAPGPIRRHVRGGACPRTCTRPARAHGADGAGGACGLWLQLHLLQLHLLQLHLLQLHL
jgi:hypothetical protein